MGLQETLSKKVGPLPLGVWLLAVGGGLGLSFLIQRDPGESEEETEEEEGTEFDAYAFDPFTYSGAVGLPDYGTQEPPKPAPRAPETNDEWLSVGVNYLISLGKNGLKAQDALARYLDGHPVTQEQAELVNLVIVELGSPPEGAPVLQEPDDDTNPIPPDPEPEEPTDDNSIRWHSATPNSVQEKYSAPAVAQILVGLGVGYQPSGMAPVVDSNDVRAGLKKLGWTKSSDLAYNVTNVSRLMRLQANPAGKGEYGSKMAVWGGAVPEFVKRQYSAEPLQEGLQRLGLKPGRVISVADFQAGLKKLGYKKADNLNLDGSAYNRVVQGIKAKKGE